MDEALAITKSVDGAAAPPGDPVTYALAFTNNGPDTATGVVITDSVPVSVTNTSVVSTGAVITQVGDPWSPGQFDLSVVDDTTARDKVNLDSGGLIPVAEATSKILVGHYDDGYDPNEAAIEVGSATLRSVGDMDMSIINLARVEAEAYAKTYGLAGAAMGEAWSKVYTNNDIVIGSGADGLGGRGFIKESAHQFIYNPHTQRGTQVIILKTPEACQVFNRLKRERKNVLFVLHNTC